jgi:hypothetical protein
MILWYVRYEGISLGMVHMVGGYALYGLVVVRDNLAAIRRTNKQTNKKIIINEGGVKPWLLRKPAPCTVLYYKRKLHSTKMYYVHMVQKEGIVQICTLHSTKVRSHHSTKSKIL